MPIKFQIYVYDLVAKLFGEKGVKSINIIFVFLFIFITSTAQAQLLVDPHIKTNPDKFDLNIGLSFSEVEYDVDGGGDTSVDRRIIGVAGAYGLTGSTDLYGELGYIIEAEPENGNDDDGFLLGLGVRGNLLVEDEVSVIGRAGLRAISESYGGGVDADIFELELGAVGRFDLNRDLSLYAGVDLFPFTEGEVDTGRSDVDFDRDDLLGLRFGADYRLEKLAFVAELALIGEEAFVLKVRLPM